MPWKHIVKWKAQKKQIWKIRQAPGAEDTGVAGTAQTYDNLWWAVVFKAGHMVPTDTPAAAKDMLDRFIQQERDWT